MPELPEVETVCRGLEPAMAGARFDRVVVRRPDLRFPFPERFVERLKGTLVLSLGRRAKYVLVRLSSHEVLIMHLGMSGRFSIERPDGTSGILGEFEQDTGNDPTHDHVVFEMSNGARITYNDPRRFGFMDLCGEDLLEAHRMMAGLGVEPLGNALSAGYLASRAKGKTADLKAFFAGSAHHRRAWQHLRLRGLVSGTARSTAIGLMPRDPDGPADQAGRAARADNM